MNRDRLSTVVALLLLMGSIGWFWTRGERFIAANGPTFDEGVHLTAGYSYWATGNFTLNAEDPPLLKLLWALPLTLGNAPPYPVELAATTPNHWKIADTWMYGSGASPRSLLDPARRVNLALGCGVILLAGWWAYRIWGSRLAAVSAAAFAAADPNFLALSCILSTDVGLTFFALTTCYLMWEYVGNPSRGLLYATGVSLGLMLATKFSAIGIVVGLCLAGVLQLRSGLPLALPGSEERRGFRPAAELAMRLAVIAILTVAADYAFINFDQWGKGLKFQLTRGSHGDGVMYLDGELSRTGWYHYFIVSLLVKLPLGLLIAVLLSSLMYFSRFSHGLRAWCSSRNVWLIIPPIVFFALASYSRVDMGIRVVLPVLPFLYLLAGGFASTGCYRPVRLAILGSCLAWCVFAAERTSPHEISYFNEIAEVRGAVKPVLADSNLDWGQGLPALKEWMDAQNVEVVYLAYFGTDRPEAHGIRYRQLPGYGRLGESKTEMIAPDAKRQIVAVSANHLYGLFLNDPSLYAWLRERRPLTTLDGSIHIFDLTDDPGAIACIRALSIH